jgi:hypothetical protein
LGDREQDVWRRPEERSGAGKEDEHGSGPERRAGVGVAPEIGAVRLGTEGCRDAEAQGSRRETHDPPARLTALDRSRTGLQSC